MSNKPYDAIVFVGRFQPVHAQHLATMRQALELADQLIVAVGSSNRARNIRDPWTYAERVSFISANFAPEDRARIRFIPVKDHLYNNTLWAARLTGSIMQEVGDRKRIGLIGAAKDETTFYLNLFPTFERIDTPLVAGIDATRIREIIFGYGRGIADTQVGAVLTAATVEAILRWSRNNGEEFARISREQLFLSQYRAMWEVAPYPPTFVTVDAVVTCGNHVLMVERKAAPGEGLMALPGGFINPKETLEDACIRELREETRLKVPAPVIRGCIKSSHVFDHPLRSLRGRTITHAYHIQLNDTELPRVKGGDDAARAFWVPLHEIVERQTEIYEDHAFIIEYFTGVSL